nr:hypothetical protein CFP56_28697 [Quercus suber]
MSPAADQSVGGGASGQARSVLRAQSHAHRRKAELVLRSRNSTKRNRVGRTECVRAQTDAHTTSRAQSHKREQLLISTRLQ